MKFLIIWTGIIGLLTFLIGLNSHPHTGYLAQIGMIYLGLTGAGIYLCYRVLKAFFRQGTQSESTEKLSAVDEQLRGEMGNAASSFKGESLPSIENSDKHDGENSF